VCTLNDFSHRTCKQYLMVGVGVGTIRRFRRVDIVRAEEHDGFDSGPKFHVYDVRRFGG